MRCLHVLTWLARIHASLWLVCMRLRYMQRCQVYAD